MRVVTRNADKRLRCNRSYLVQEGQRSTICQCTRYFAFITLSSWLVRVRVRVCVCVRARAYVYVCVSSLGVAGGVVNIHVYKQKPLQKNTEHSIE